MWNARCHARISPIIPFSPGVNLDFAMESSLLSVAKVDGVVQWTGGGNLEK